MALRPVDQASMVGKRHGHGHPPQEGAKRSMMDYEKIRHAVKTGDKIMELAVSLGLDPTRHTIKDLADMLLQQALAEEQTPTPLSR
jgi:hypothetical protein